MSERSSQSSPSSISAAVPNVTPVSPPMRAGCDHAVQFYESEGFLLQTVAQYFARGLKAGEAAVAIMRASRLEPLKKRLELLGVPIKTAVGEGRLILLDAEKTLVSFMVDGKIDRSLFEGTIGGVLAPLRDRFGKIHAYGEMVDILWTEGLPNATLQLEEEWNRLAEGYSFSLLCGYTIAAFSKASDTSFFQGICSAHQNVIPTESFTKVKKDEEQQRAIALLQQKAQILEAQLRERCAIEEALRARTEALTQTNEAIQLEIDHRKAVEKKLSAREQELTDFVENAPVGLHWVGPDGKILWANASELASLGYPKDEYVGHHIAEFHADEAVINDILQRLSSNETLHNYEARVKCKDGGIKTVLISSNVYREDGRFVHTRCFMRDITERKAAEEALKEREQELAGSNAELKQFAHVASHDLKEPCRMVTSYLQLLQMRYEKTFDGEAKEYIGFAVDGARRMHRLIDDLLNYATAGNRVNQPPTRVDCNEVFEEVRSNLRSSIEENNAHVTCDPLPVVLAERTQLVQLFQNLISNALKFKRDERPTVNVMARREGTSYRFEVRDNGIGINPEYFDRIFGLFQRLHERGRYPGTGLGLAVCKKIVERHRGSIWLESQIGKGTTFYFTLPGSVSGPRSGICPPSPVAGKSTGIMGSCGSERKNS